MEEGALGLTRATRDVALTLALVDQSPIFSNRAMFRNLFPGFGIAVVAFTAYVAYDETVNAAQKKDHHGAGHH
ncbi:hypothetical protein JCM21900_006851 [Sporobolomyces salmonicolor]